MKLSNCRAAAAACLVAAAANLASAADSLPFKIFVRDEGVVRVRFEDLAASGLTDGEWKTAALSLRTHGEPVAIHVADDGNGSFGPGDWIEFVGERLAGRGSYFHKYAEENVYWLGAGDREPARMTDIAAPAVVEAAAPAQFDARLHLEHEELLPRFSARSGEDEGDEWYWAKLTHLDAEPFATEATLAGLDAGASGRASLRLRLRGWSRQAGGRKGEALPDHAVAVLLNGEVVAEAEWSGTDGYVLEVAAERIGARLRDRNRIALRVPERRPDGAAEPIVDVVMLDWIEIAYPRTPRVEQGQTRLEATAAGAALAALSAPAARSLRLYSREGHRIQTVATPTPFEFAFALPAGAAVVHAVPDDAFGEPVAVLRSRPMELSQPEGGADYVIVVHPRLREAIEPLAAFHRSRGLGVIVAEIGDVYDEFNFGIEDPAAIRAFLAHAHDRWQGARPRWALLVGDASWDTKHATVERQKYDDLHFVPGSTDFGSVRSSKYRFGPSPNDRNLVPTGSYAAGDGHAASDNYFVSRDDDFRPFMAIGRIPVVEPAEVAAIVEKTIRYASSAPAGEWRRRLLLVTNEETYIQRGADRLAMQARAGGLEAAKVYPSADERDNAAHQLSLQRFFDDGQLLVYFHGHGGRFIWRTGPPDLGKNHDLFTLAHLDALVPNERLPIVLSMTCYSAPFDHPDADSIGEKFLRLPGRGAVAVLAASWRNSPDPAFSRNLLAELTAATADAPDRSIGEAILRAKGKTANRAMVEQYNLLGDPAIALALPNAIVKVERRPSASLPETSPALDVVATVDAPELRGRGVVEWSDTNGDVVLRREVSVAGGRLEAQFSLDPEAGSKVRVVAVYVRSEAEGFDAVGADRLPFPADEGPWGGRASPADMVGPLQPGQTWFGRGRFDGGADGKGGPMQGQRIAPGAVRTAAPSSSESPPRRTETPTPPAADP